MSNNEYIKITVNYRQGQAEKKQQDLGFIELNRMTLIERASWRNAKQRVERHLMRDFNINGQLEFSKASISEVFIESMTAKDGVKIIDEPGSLDTIVRTFAKKALENTQNITELKK